MTTSLYGEMYSEWIMRLATDPNYNIRQYALVMDHTDEIYFIVKARDFLDYHASY